MVKYFFIIGKFSKGNFGYGLKRVATLTSAGINLNNGKKKLEYGTEQIIIWSFPTGKFIKKLGKLDIIITQNNYRTKFSVGAFNFL